MTMQDTTTLTQLLAKKCGLLLELRQLGVRQAELIDRSEMAALLSLLSLKNRLLTSLQTLERQLDPFRDQSPDQRQWPSEEERRRGAELAEACQRLLAEVIDTEKRSESQLILRRDDAAAQLHAVHHAAQAREAYVEPVIPTAIQVDFSSE
jgi:hypothetical protein